MEYRNLGRSGLRVSVLTMGTMTFGGGERFDKVGNTDLAGARRQIDLCLDAGVNLIDTANAYSRGLSEEIVGEALGAKRQDVLIASKVRFRMGDGPNDEGLSRHHILRPGRGLAEAPALGHPRRPIPAPVGRADPARGDPLRPRHPGRTGQGPLRRRLQLLGLAPDEGPRHRRRPRLAAPRHPADPLYPRGPRSRVRARPRRRRRRRRHPGLEPDRRRPALGQIRPRRPPRPVRSPAGASRRSATSPASGASSTPSRRLPPPAASPAPRSRSPGSSAAPASPRWSSAAATRTSSATA